MSTERAPLTRDKVIAGEDGAGTPTHLAKDSPLTDSDTASLGPSSGSTSPEPNDEESIFALLFQQCDKDGIGEVEVEKLINYIRKVRLGEQHGDKEEVYDSQDDMPTMQYNLHLLKAMLECNSTEEGKVDQPTYSHIIRMWVKDVRDRSEKAASSEPPLEVSQLSDSPDSVEEIEAFPDVSYGTYATGGVDESRESFETSGGRSSSLNEHDRIDLINSVADLKLDNKRLQDMNKALQIQMDNSEEHLRDIQTENQHLKQEIKELKVVLNRLEQVEGSNAELVSEAEKLKGRCRHLTSVIEKQEREVAHLTEDLKSVRNQLSATELDKNSLNAEGKTLKQLLLQKEELLSQQDATCAQVDAQLQLESQRVKELSQMLEEVKQSRDELKFENTDLQTQLRLGRVRSKQPLSSTPYRPSAPSWHEEMMEQECLTSKSSPILRYPDDVSGVGGVNGVRQEVGGEMDEESTAGLSASESFRKILEEKKSKINEKHNVIFCELDELINQPSLSSSHHSADSSRVSRSTIQSFESKLRELFQKKRKVEKQNSQLAAQVDELKKKLANLERAKVITKGDAPPTKDEAVDAGANSEKTPVDEHARMASDNLDTTNTSYQFPSPELRRRPKLSRSAVLAQVDLDSGSSVIPPLTFSHSPSTEKSQQTDIDVITGTMDELAVEKEAEMLESQSQGWFSFLSSSAYRILKTVALLLFIVFACLMLIVLYVILMDLLSRCGSHCPYSPAYVFYSKFHSYLQYTRTSAYI